MSQHFVDTDVDSSSATPGRRRDPSIRPRALEAALNLYAREGWHGFTFDTVSREAGIGKPALYRRWESPAHLLIDAFEYLDLPTARDCGSLEEDLRHFASEFISWNADPRNLMIANRLGIERSINEELAAAYYTKVYQPRYQAVRALAARAQLRGEVKHQSTSIMAVEVVLGAMTMRQTFAAKADSESINAMLTKYLNEVIDVLIAGLQTRSDADHR